MSVHKKRISRVIDSLKKFKEPAAMLLSSAPEYIRSRDIAYPYRQNSDIFYLTGSQEKDLQILLSSKSNKPILVVPPKDKTRALWDGDQGNYQQIASNLGAELVVSKEPFKELKSRLRGHSHLLHQNTPLTLSDRISQDIQATPAMQRGKLPRTFSLCDVILEEMRLYKDPAEVVQIKKAAEVTSQALFSAASLIQPGMPEHVIARTIEYWFGLFGGEPGFGTIAASGKNAAILHYRSCNSNLKPGEMLLIDCGAELDLYSADITRVFPVSKSFSKEQKILYDIVLKAQSAAIKKVKDGVFIRSIYEAAAKVLTEGLVELKVLRGKISSLMAKRAYKDFFPHGIGHSLGLDVHDVGDHRGNNDARLHKGMVFTIEPGLYLPKAIGKVKPFGIRIEDDILVTKNGCEILTSAVPKKIEDVEAMMA